ncbi:ATP synthase F0 subunit B [Candidatus Gracilibacteria bacterium]|nr:ATP synthase F0 subunit B [Candidatus Gracilibacteria bacterium]NUJ98842.1 ATP synthase F0 subunit B [Candidatus Gracilibacteria bacterium]
MEEISIGVVVAQIINFSLLVFLFKHFLGKKIVLLIEERRKKLKNINESERVAKDKIESAEKEASDIVLESRNQAEEMKRESEVIAKRTREKILSEAERDAQALVDGAKEDVEKMRNTMLESMKSKIIDLSLQLNKQLFDKEIVNRDFMEKQISSIKN